MQKDLYRELRAGNLCRKIRTENFVRGILRRELHTNVTVDITLKTGYNKQVSGKTESVRNCIREEAFFVQISSRFTIAIHIFACMETFGGDYKITSDFLASSINVNPVIIRKILSQLRNAGLIKVARGTGGTTAARPIDEITFYDVCLAVDLLEDGDLFHFHENPNPACPVGRNIHTVLDHRLEDIQKAMENEMKKYTIADVVNDINRCMETS